MLSTSVEVQCMAFYAYDINRLKIIEVKIQPEAYFINEDARSRTSRRLLGFHYFSLAT